MAMEEHDTQHRRDVLCLALSGIADITEDAWRIDFREWFAENYGAPATETDWDGEGDQFISAIKWWIKKHSTVRGG